MDQIAEDDEVSVGSSNNSNKGNNAKVGRKTKRFISPSLQQAMTHVKDFMTDPQKAHILYRESKIYYESENYQGSIDCLCKAVSFNPSAISLYVLRASCHKALFKWTEAYFDYSFAIRLEPENGSHFCNRGMCLSKLKKIEMGLEDLDTACRLDPCAFNYFSRATIYVDAKKYTKAIQDLSQALLSDNSTIEIRLRCLYRRASAYFDLKSFNEAIVDLNDVLQADPNGVNARILLGKCLKMVDELKRAEEQLTHALHLDPDSAVIYTERGDIRYRTKRKNKIIDAIYDFDKAVKIYETKISSLISSACATASFLSLHPSSSSSTISVSSSTSSRSINNNVNVNVSVNNTTISSSRKNSNVVSSLRRLTNTNTQSNPIPIPSNNNDITHKKPLLSPKSSPNIIEDRAEDHDNDNDEDNEVEGPTPPLALPITLPLLANHSNYYSTVFGLQDTEEGLADTLYKRAQAKLMLNNVDASIYLEALDDCKKAVAIMPLDEEFQLVHAVCLIRLNLFPEAMEILESLLQRNPQHERALYHQAYCQRGTGRKTDAIEGLTKIISFIEDGCGLTSSKLEIPVHFIYEARGSLFHDVQAHKLALSDLGIAVSLHPERPENFYLRADCHSKLGNYELAIKDYNLAESKGLVDLPALHVSRGMVHRLVGNNAEALRDFDSALNKVVKTNDKIHTEARVRVYMLKALCWIDQGEYSRAYQVLLESRELVYPLIISNNMHGVPSTIDESHEMNDEKEMANSIESSAFQASLRRLHWLLVYHSSLCLYMMKDFVYAEEELLYFLTEDGRALCPDNFTFGCCMYFLGNAQRRINKLDNAVIHLKIALDTHWSIVERNKFLGIFTMGKAEQMLGNHMEAVKLFTLALEIEREDSNENAYVYFRRAWCYKSLKDYKRAGVDFEEARTLKIQDPNFAVDYKKSHTIYYIEIETEPDLLEIFPALLPLPGSI